MVCGVARVSWAALFRRACRQSERAGKKTAFGGERGAPVRVLSRPMRTKRVINRHVLVWIYSHRILKSWRCRYEVAKQTGNPDDGGWAQRPSARRGGPG